MYTVVDLFAGAGGLSLGFMQAEKYDIKAAFENSQCMQETYRLNHPGVEVYGDVCTADYEAIKKKYGEIDVVIGGPPCQGFSNVNRQKNHAVSKNNMLVKQYMRAILELKPKAFVMENVSMLKSNVHRLYLEEGEAKTVEKYGISTKPTPIHLLDAKHVFDGALEIVRDCRRIQQFLWPEPHYFVLNVIYKSTKSLGKMKSALEKHRKRLCSLASDYVDFSDNDHISHVSANAFRAVLSYYAGELDVSEIKSRIEPAILIQRMLSKTKEINENHIVVDDYSVKNGITANIHSFAVYDYFEKILQAPENDYVLDKDILRQDIEMADNHSKENRSKNMSHIRSTNSKPEEVVRKYLFSNGFRYRKNVRTMPGCPDILVPKYHTVIFVNGCFWHKHDCGRFVWPSSNLEYWIPKINRNVERDEENHKKLREAGWKVLIIWECELKKSVREERLVRLIKAIKEE
ncbi:MAG TPA: DNA mismatch endonuclease Vsr [Methanocorpusculum sp.]|nr:DNA mismatch endonuclease Vsr [Methanocorpusculum sp.]